MAVQTTKSGGIYIEISGDYSKLQESLREVKRLANMSAASISETFKGAAAPKDVANNAANLAKYFATAGRAAQATKADLSAFDAHFRNIGRSIGIAEKDLARFANMQRQAYQNQAAKAFADNLSGVQRLLGATDNEMNKLAKSLGGVGNEFGKASSGMKVFGVELGGVAKLAAGAFAAKGVADFAKESFDLAARYETLGVVVQQVGKTAGYSAVEIDKNVSALRGLGIAGIEARQNLTKLIQSQVNLSAAQKLARVAQDAAVIGGVNSSEAFARLVHGIQSAQVEVLRNIGIGVNFEQSYNKMAASLGKTTDELTEQEKIQARVNIVMETGERIAGTYEASMNTLGKQLASLRRIQQDFGTDVGGFLLRIAQASGALPAYSHALESLAAASVRGQYVLGGGRGEDIDAAFRTGGLQAGRELKDALESAEKEAERLAAQLAASFKVPLPAIDALRDKIVELEKDFAHAAKYGFETKDIAADIAKLTAEMDGLAQAVARSGAGADFAVGEFAKIRTEFQMGRISAEQYRRAMLDLSILAQKPQENLPASNLFTFKPMIAEGGKIVQQGDFRSVDKTLSDLRAAFAKTEVGAKQAKESTLKENKELIAALMAQGKMAKAEGDKILAAFAAEEGKLAKGARSAALSVERTSYQAAEAMRAAEDSLKNLQLRHSELLAQLDGNSLGAALARSVRDYETQMDAIAKKEADIAKNRDLWAKGGKLGDEAERSLAAQQKALDAEKVLLAQIKEANDALAKRAYLAREFQSGMDYAGLLGDMRAYYNAEVNLLDVQALTLSGREKLLNIERQRIALARSALDVEGMWQTGMQKMAQDAQQRTIAFWEGMPDTVGAVTDAVGTFFADFASGTKNAQDAIADMGKTFQRIGHQIMEELAMMTVRMALFGNSMQGNKVKGGGGFGGLIGGAVSLIGGLFGSAQGNAFSAGTELAAFRNRVVTRPTTFAFARGGVPNVGLMGEKPGSPGEAIMPLTRTRGGDLGVAVDLGGTAKGGDVYFQVSMPAIHVEYTAQSGTTPDVDGRKIAESLGEQLRRELEGMVTSVLIKQSRPGGMLNAGIGA